MGDDIKAEIRQANKAVSSIPFYRATLLMIAMMTTVMTLVGVMGFLQVRETNRLLLSRQQDIAQVIDQVNTIIIEVCRPDSKGVCQDDKRVNQLVLELINDNRRTHGCREVTVRELFTQKPTCSEL